MNKKTTSWESVAKWYDQYIDREGNYFHSEIILPQLIPLLALDANKKHSLLDVGCGQGIMSRSIPKDVAYFGMDSSKKLIQMAKARKPNSSHSFLLHDATHPFPFETTFSHAVILLALQNMKEPEKVLSQIAKHLQDHGRLVIVLNHPCFRIPRQSSWGYDEPKKLQYRRVDQYMSPMEIPIQMNPGQKEKSSLTYSYHHSLSALSHMLKKSGFWIDEIKEWCSEKTSVGARAKAENRCRKEFPMFLAIACEKRSI
ncbi:MAG: class I SAM-dependent methyltransferase [Simkaniaceae bacterium]|nr:class I SAM-dependent methyltransferase [Simkaniaceae bacterium]